MDKPFDSSFFDILPDRRGTNCDKWDTLAKRYGKEDIIPMFVADMDFLSPPCVAKALGERAAHGVFGYTFMGDDYREAFQNWEREVHGVTVEKEELMTIPGVITGLSWAIHALCREGQNCIVPTPAYPPFFGAPKAWGLNVCECPMLLDNNCYSMDFDALERLVSDPATTGLILCNPQNPTGRVWSREELIKIVTLCRENHVFVFADEIHSDIIMPGASFTSVRSLPRELLDCAVILNAPSKTFNLPGLQTSNMIIPDETLRQKIREDLGLHHASEPNLMGLCGGAAAYRDGRPWRDAMISYVDENFTLLEEFLRTRIPKVKFTKPQATYLAWLDFRAFGLTSKEIEEKLIKEGLGLGLGTIFGADVGEGFMRLTAACPRKTLLTALEKMEKALGDS